MKVVSIARIRFSAQRTSRTLLAIAIASALVACTSVQSNVEVFHDLSDEYAGKTIAILPGNQEKAGTLEFLTYSEKLAFKLAEVGFRVVERTEGPVYVAFLGYAVGEGQQVTSTYSIPHFGITGYSSSTTYGTLNTYGGMGTYSGTTTYNPTYGVTGYSTGVTTEIHYPRVVLVDIYEIRWPDTENSPQVYDLTIGSFGECGNLSQVIDEMLQAGFEEFPGTNGSARTVEVPLEGDC